MRSPVAPDKRGYGEREYRYECANQHRWVCLPAPRLQCPICATVTVARLKPVDSEDELARVLWEWSCEHGHPTTTYPYDRLIDITKDDLWKLARSLAPWCVPPAQFENANAR